MTLLYVIGNGFDLWHGLPTGYPQFYDFAKETLEEIENYYSFNFSGANPWHDFENTLGAFNWDEFYETYNDIDVRAEDFRPSWAYGLEDDLEQQADQHVETIKECFHEWVSGIDISIAEKKLTLPENAQFITFNYTSTLESTYDIEDDRVLHIHGRAETFDELIFGHGETMEEEPELDENGDSNRTMFSDAQSAAKYPFYALQKPVAEVLETHREFFESLTPTCEVIVIGHSLNKVDLPYFKKLVGLAPDARWKVCIYRPEEEAKCIQALTSCGVPPNKINIFTYDDL